MSKKTMRLTKLVAAVGVVLSCALAAPVQASIVVRMDLEELTDAAAVIAVGTVRSTDSHWTEDGLAIVTDVRLDVADAVKGTQSGAVVEFRVLGGVVDNLAQSVPGEPTFAPGEEALVFLELRGDGHTLGVVGMSQGKFSVVRTGDDATAIQATGDLVLAEVAPAPGVVPGSTGPHVVTSISAPPAPSPRPLGALLNDLRGYAAPRP